MKNRKFWLWIVLAVLLLGFVGCSSEDTIKGTYLSDDEETMIVCDSQIMYIVSGDDVGGTRYTLSGETLYIGESAYYFERGEDSEELMIGSEIYTKTSCPLSVRWKLIKWSSKNRMETCTLGEIHPALGVIQWMILDPIFMIGTNSAGIYSGIGGWMALIGLVLTIFIVLKIYFVIADNKKYKKK